MSLAEAAPAKLNLALHVRRRRDDGYHDLETIFAFTDFGDTLTGCAADILSLTVEGEFAAGLDGGDNLILRAASALADAGNVQAGARLHLVKRIPVAAGLGGGSADAAAALRLLNRLWRLDWSLEQLAALGASLGADIPACVHARALLGSGRGEHLAPYQTAVSGMSVLLVNPRVAVPTGPVFADWDGIDRGALDAAMPVAVLRNDLESPALTLVPVIGEVLAALRGSGATLARMSGSGATCFGVYTTAQACDSASNLISLAHADWWQVTSHLR